jgi:type II secretory pathway pseudopilin PulG
MSGTTLQIKFNITTIVVIILLLFGVAGGFYLYQNKVNNLKNELEIAKKLQNALLDSATVYQNKKGEWVTEKLTLQETLKNLDKLNGQLTASQKELLSRIEGLSNKNTTIAAALIQSQITIDSLLHHGHTGVDTLNKTLSFSDSLRNAKKDIILTYDFKVFGAVPAILNIKPTLMIKSLGLPNTQFIEFHWKNDKKAGYPVAFSVTNSNDYFKTINIDSYIIPEITLPTVKPTFWQKVGNFFTKSGGKLVWFGAGGVGGAVLYHYLAK